MWNRKKNGADDLSLSLSHFGVPYLLSHSQPQMHLCGITGYATLAVMTRKEEEAGRRKEQKDGKRTSSEDEDDRKQRENGEKIGGGGGNVEDGGKEMINRVEIRTCSFTSSL